MKGLYDQYNLHHPREIAGSSLRSVSKIPHCCLQIESGPYLSPSVTGHPLRPVKDHRLGEPFPHQQSNLTQAHQKTIHISFFIPDLQEFFGRFLRVTHPFAMLKKAFDLHVLSFSLAFILSQDQTHRFKQYKIKKKGVYPATGSPTATLLRLHYNYKQYCKNIYQSRTSTSLFCFWYFLC